VIANGNVVKDDDVIFFLTTARGTQVGTQVIYINSCYWSKSLVGGVPEVSIDLPLSHLTKLFIYLFYYHIRTLGTSYNYVDSV
jgi:hypothetical protein